MMKEFSDTAQPAEPVSVGLTAATPAAGCAVPSPLQDSLRALESELSDLVASRVELGPDVYSILMACWCSALECVLTMHGLTSFDIDGIYRRYRAQAGRRADA